MSDAPQTRDEKVQVREFASPEFSHPASTIIVGLGNPILGDDGVGWRVAENVADHLSPLPDLTDQITIERLSLGGLSLMENLIGYQRAILVDAINLGRAPQGSIYVFPLAELPDHAQGHLSSTHDTSLQTALDLGRSMGAELPEEIVVVGIESAYVYDFSEELSPAVAAAVPLAAKKVLELIGEE
jgi:hydrogenase maturation protease